MIEEGTPEYEVFLAAIEVAVDPPINPKRPTCQVYVPYITRLRNALEAFGIDWKKIKEGGDTHD
jgi:hypothetical protein